MTNEIKSQVLAIVNDIENGRENDCCYECGVNLIWADDEYWKDCECGACVNRIMSGQDYTQDVLDVQYIINSKKEYLGSRLLVAFGGPNIWINTQTKTVEGHWWGDSFTATYYRDEMEIDSWMNELFEC